VFPARSMIFKGKTVITISQNGYTETNRTSIYAKANTICFEILDDAF
jgi:hypothetical protein